MKIDNEGNVLVDWEYKYKVLNLRFKLHKLREDLESIGYTFEERERAVKRHKLYTKQLKELKQRGHI